MKIAIGSDHAGFDAKEKLKARLAEAGHEVKDVGAHSTASVDYPDPARDVASLVAKGEVEKGVLVCGSGIGMSIAANKVHGARAALVTDEWHAEMARRHNDANIICVGGRVNADEALGRFVDRFIGTAFEGGRHATRVGKITALEHEER